MSLMDRCLTRLIEGTVRKKNKVRYVDTVRFKNQRWAVPSTKLLRYFFGTNTGTDGIFSKMLSKYRYHGTLFSVFCYHFTIENQTIAMSLEWS